MKHINQVIKSNGPATKMEKDTNYCTVATLAATLGISFDKAYDFASKEWSRRRGKGVKTLTMLGSFPQAVGKEYSKMILDSVVTRVKAEQDYKQPQGHIITRDMTLSTFSKKYPRGKYYILVKGHALAVINGEIVDHTDKPKRRIRYAWKVS